MEELFFAGLIGNVQIDSVIPYILRMEADEYRVSLLNVSLNSEANTGFLDGSFLTHQFWRYFSQVENIILDANS